MTVPLEVEYSIGGTAKNGIDYEKEKGKAVIRAHQESVTIGIRAIDDIFREEDETIVFTLLPKSSYGIDWGNKIRIAIPAND